MRVLFTNNYDMRRARAGWRGGSYPSQHLFGTAELGSPFEVVDVPIRGEGLLADLTRRSGHALGDFGLQFSALSRLREDTLIYGAQARDLAILSLLRRLRLLRVPLVGVFHGKTAPSSVARLAVAGFDRVITLSHMTRDALLEIGIPPNHVHALGWGPDLDFRGFANASPAAPDAPVAATGKTGRDMPLLVEALRRTGISGRVYGDVAELSAAAGLPANVKVIPAVPASTGSQQPFSYEHTLHDLRSASLIAIPLRERHPLHGLTELADAIACARPVIVTRAPYFDIDVEAIGCGWWVEAGDIDGWTRALRDAMSEHGRLVEMGQAGREWASQHWNARRFAEGLRRVLLDVAPGT